MRSGASGAESASVAFPLLSGTPWVRMRVPGGGLLGASDEVKQALRAHMMQSRFDHEGWAEIRSLHHRGRLAPRLFKVAIRDAVATLREAKAALAAIGRAYAEAIALLHEFRSRAAADRAQYRVALDRKNATASLQAALRAPVTLATKVPADVGPPLRALLDVRALTSAPRPGPLAALPAAA